MAPTEDLPTENVDIEIDGRIVEFTLWTAGTDYEVDASAIEELNVWSCIDTLEAHSGRIERVIARQRPIRIDLWIEFDKSKLFPWEKNLLGIAIHKEWDKDEKRKKDDGTYVAEFTLNTAIGAQKHELREAVLSALGGTGFELNLLEPATHEMPMFEEEGWHQWSCAISAFPKDASFRDLFALRDSISQGAFLPAKSITTPYLALRMVQLGQAQALLGIQESEWMECKSFAYEFKNLHEQLWKHELAEDVAQFANAESGGLLAIGFHTKRETGVDTIDKITPVPASTTRLQTYRDILRQRIHPPVSRLLIESFPWSGGEIVCIFVPPQKYENQPYLVSGSIVHGRYIRSGITIVRRQGDASIPITAEEIHSTLVAGRAFLRGRTDMHAESAEPDHNLHATGPAKASRSHEGQGDEEGND